jgi:hypothetical protein
MYLDGQQLASHPNSNGSFRISGVVPGQHVLCLAAPDNMRGAHVSVTVIGGEETSVGTVEPTLGGRITGTVTKQEDSGELVPLPDVEVTATPGDVWILNGGRQDAPPIGSDQPPIIAFTDADGVYDMRAVPPGGYVVTVSVPGLEGGIQWVWVEAGHTAAADFVLRPTPPEGVGTVEGSVYGIEDSGLVPLEGARVTIMPDRPWMPIIMDNVLSSVAAEAGIAPDIFPPPIWDSFSTLTDVNGHYSLNVPAGPAYIDVFAEGYEWQQQRINVLPRETIVVNFELQPWIEPPVPLPTSGATGQP